MIERRLEREVIYEGRIIRVYNDTVELENGHISSREIL
jgi:hypothetical protein